MFSYYKICLLIILYSFIEIVEDAISYLEKGKMDLQICLPIKLFICKQTTHIFKNYALPKLVTLS